MTAICKKEVKSYLTSMTGYVFIAFILLLAGVYFTAYNLQMGYPIFGYTLSAITFVFLIITPILTMRVLAEEKKQKTDQLLLTSPLSVKDIVLGKFTALMVIFLIPMIILCIYPIILKNFGTVSLKMAYVAVIGFFLLGCANIAIGIFLSSITESQIIAAVVTFVVLFICYMMSGIKSFFSETAITSLIAFSAGLLVCCGIIYMVMKNLFTVCLVAVIGEAALLVLYTVKQSLFEGAIQKVLGIFDISSHFDNFVSGILDIGGIIYFLSIIAVFLFLTVQSIQKRRWS